MNRIQQELKVIPLVAWVIAVLGCLGMLTLSMMVFIPQDAEVGHWPGIGKAAFAVGVSLIVLMYVLLIGYVYGDARRRGMRYVLWTLLAIFIPNAIGVIVYFIFRDPPMRPCPQCSANIQGGFTFCPGCGVSLRPSCPACRRAVESGWAHCPGCGAGLHAAV